MFLDEPGDVSDPLREARDVAVQDRELRHEHEQAQVERALEELLRRLHRGRKIDRSAIEGIVARGKQPLRGRDEIHEFRVAFKVEVGPAGVVLRDKREREGVRRGADGGRGWGRRSDEQFGRRFHWRRGFERGRRHRRRGRFNRRFGLRSGFDGLCGGLGRRLGWRGVQGLGRRGRNGRRGRSRSVGRRKIIHRRLSCKRGASGQMIRDPCVATKSARAAVTSRHPKRPRPRPRRPLSACRRSESRGAGRPPEGQVKESLRRRSSTRRSGTQRLAFARSDAR